MPLPKDYYDILKSGDKPLETPTTPSGTGQASSRGFSPPDITQEAESAWGGIGDALWSAGEGFTSGMTWGLTDLAGATGQESWEEMSGGEKAGWILGEGASFFAPWGPFGLLGKGSKALAKGGNKFIGKAAQEAAEQGINPTMAKAALAAGKKGTEFTDDIARELNKAAQDDLGVRWIKDLGATGKAALDASENLTLSGARAVQRAFKDAGLEQIDINDAAKISSEFVEGLKGGEYVNDVAEWVARSLSGRIPDTANGFMSKYLGMAAQDMLLMGVHGLGAGKIKALANNEDFDVTGSLSHAALMSLGFPLIRKIPNLAGMGSGGMASASQGIKAYMNQFKNANYKAIQEAHGDDVVKNILKVMVNGSKKDLLSNSKLSEANWKAGGKVYANGDEILKALPNMKIEDTITILQKMNKAVNQNIIKEWGPKFIEDTIGSIPRMGFGILAMNPWVVNKDAWGSMEGPELASHLFMSAVMTRGRGAWGHEQQRAYFADFTPYHEALNVLGVNTKNVQDVLRFHDGKNIHEGLGIALGSHEAGMAITKIFDKVVETSETRPTSKDYNPQDHALALELGSIYNIIKKTADPKFQALNVQNLDGQSLNSLSTKLQSVKFQDGTTIKELGFEGALVKLTLEPAKRGLNIYKRMLNELSKLGYEVNVSKEGKVIGNLVLSKEGNSIGDANTYNRTLIALSDIAEATVRDGENVSSSKINYEKIVKNSGLSTEQFNQKTREIIDNHMGMIANEYGGMKNIAMDPVGEAGKLNPMIEFFKQAKNIEAAERVYSVVTGKFPTGDKLNDKSLTESLDKLFLLPDGKYASSIDAYKNIIKDFVKKPANEKEEILNTKVLENFNDLRDLFELRKKVVGVSSKDPSKQITIEGISIAQTKWKNLNTQLPREWKQDWVGHTRHLYIDRILKAKGLDRRAVNLVSMLADANIAVFDGQGKVVMPSKKAVIDELKAQGLSKKNIEKYDQALNNIKKVLGEDIVTESNFSFVQNGKRQSEAVDVREYLKASKMLSDRTFTDLLINTQTILTEMKEVGSSGTRKNIQEIYNKATELIESLNPDRTIKPVDDPIKEIKILQKELESLESVARNEATKKDLSDSIIELNNIIKAIDKNTKKFNITSKTVLTEAEQLSGDKYGIHKALTEPLQKRLEKIFNQEFEAMNRMQELVVKIENLATMGKSSGGLDKAQTTEIIENLSREWHALYTGKTNKSVEVLSELISKVNQKGFFGDALSLLESVDMQINRAVILKNEHHILNADAVKMSDSLESGHKTHEHHRSVKEILKEYNLLNKDGDIDPAFRQAIIQNPKKALNENIRKNIFSQKGKTVSQKNKEWTNFREKSAIEMLTNIYNSKPVNRIKIIGDISGGNKRGVIEFNNNAPNIQHPNTKYFEEKGFKVHYIDDNVSVDVNGRLRNTSLDIASGGSADKVQSFLNQALRVGKSSKEIIDNFRSIDHGIKESDIKRILENPTEYVFYLRLSPMDKVMFVATDKNLKALNAEFKSTYDSIEGSLKGKNKDVFKAMFGDLLQAPNTSRANVELKMLLSNLNYTGKRGEIEKLITEYAGDASPEKLAKIQTNMYKRGFLSDGGTTQPMHTEVLRWTQKNHPNKDVRETADYIIKQGGFNAAVIGDGASEGAVGRKHPLSIENIELGQLQIIGNAGGFLGELAKTQQVTAKDQPSLLSSLLDGGKFASERLMKLVMAQKGMLNTDFSDSPNGAKTIIFATGNQQMLGKGYMVYHPEIAKQMPKDVDIMLGESSAKTFSGMSNNNTPLKPFEISAGKGKWQNTLKNMSGDNKMLMPIESIGVSFTSKNESGVAISPSIFDFQSSANIKAATTWMGFEAKLKDIAVQWDSVHRDGAKLAEWLYEINKSEGNPLDKGDAGLTKLLFSYGAMPNNPLTQKALRRLLRSSNYKHLSKATNRGGEDNFIVPNIDGKLSVPVYAELYTAGEGPSNRNIQDRASVTYGGIGLNSNTASRTLGNSVSGITSNLQGERFIYRDANGVDVVISFEGKKFEYFSTFYDKSTNRSTNLATKKPYQYKSIDKNGVETFKDVAITMDKASQQKAEAQLVELNRLVKAHGLNFKEAFRLLEGELVSKVDSKGVVTDMTLKTDSGLKMKFGSMSHAIPVIGHDKPILRIEKIMENMDGLTEVNVHDLRTVMQRDNDGDHLFTHTSMPWELFKSFARENGRKDDFRMWERNQVLNSDYINIFGIGSNGKAGEKASQVGFQNYASRLHNAKMMTGQIIGARNAISWLNRLGFQKQISENVSMPLLKDFIKDEGMSANNWKVLDKFYDTIQNALDIHGGIHESINTTDKLRDFLYFGQKDIHSLETGDKAFDKHNNPELTFFNENHATFGKTRVEREVFYELLRTLKKANMIQNDTWDERGSRSPEPHEIKSAYYDMKSLFQNPTQYLANKMQRKIGRLQGVEKDAFVAEYANMFYNKTMDINNVEKSEGLYWKIIKGEQGSLLKKVFSFDSNQLSPTNPEQGFDYSTGGTLMKGLIGTNGFWDANYGGLVATGTDAYNAAGLFVKNIENFVETSRVFGKEGGLLNSLNKLNLGINISSFTNKQYSAEIKNGVTNGVLRELIHRQHDNVFGTLEYFRSEKFANPNKVEKLQMRLRNLQEAMDIMDQQIAKDMTINAKDLQFLNIKEPFSFNQHKYLKKGQMLDVYRIRGDVNVKDKEKPQNLYTFTHNERQIDYGMLEFVGRFDKDSNVRPFAKGYSYIVNRNPKQMKSQSSNEARYSDALFKATYGNEIAPEVFLGNRNTSDFRDQVRQLRASISSDYYKTVDLALSNRVLSDGIFAIQNAKEARGIEEFLTKWTPEVINSTDPVKVLLRYLLQPQVTPSAFYKDAITGHERPAYKTNEHLYKTVLEWSERNGNQDFVKELVKDVEHYAAGKNMEIDITSYERGSMDKMDYTSLGDMAIPYRTLAKHLNVFFSSPVLLDKLNGVINNSRSPIQYIKGKDGELRPIKQKAEKDDYWLISKDQTGESC